MALSAVLVFYLIIYVGALSRNAMKKYYYVGKADRMERTIMITGTGKATGSNDIAMTTIGFSNTDKDVAKAQAENKKVMDPVMNDLAKIGIADKDMQTSYTIYPEYNYTQDRGQELRGYRVSNQVTVKIRDLTKIPEILGLAGKHGANEVNGLSFTIDDTENLKTEARDKALASARAKALKLAATLGVKLGGVINYSEYEGGDYYYPMKAYAAEGGGMGGGAPEVVASGSRDVSVNVTVTYEILSR